MIRRRVLALVGACSLAALVACSGTESGVSVQGADAIDATSSSDAAETPAPTIPTDATSPDTSDTTEPDAAEPAATTLPDTSEPDAGGPSPDTGDDTGDGIGDELYPDLGNPGVDVVDYALDLSYDPTTEVIDGTVTLQIAFTDDRDEFTLDASGPDVSAVTIDGEAVDFVLDDPELRITPAAPIDEGDTHTVVVTYRVQPGGASSLSGLPSGWFTTDTGSYVLNEPDGARTWLPSNDHPSDKATWTYRLTVPAGTSAIANGRLVGTTSGPEGDTWEWREDEPMPTYLMLVLTGPYTVVEDTSAGGVELISVALADDVERMRPFFDGIDEQIAFFEERFGPYPLDRYGLAITDSFGGLAMETQGRSLFSRDDMRDPEGYVEQLLLSHELAHQWFGNAVSPARWRDIWLNESFATYLQWMWLEHEGFTTVDQEAEFALANRQDGAGDPTGDPGADQLFSYNSYDGGAVVLHALRLTIGDEAFFEALRTWAQDHEGQSLTTDDFVDHVEDVAGQSLDTLFDTWLFADRLPSTYPTTA